MLHLRFYCAFTRPYPAFIHASSMLYPGITIHKRMYYLEGMNFLAHAYLSFGQADLLTGNLITDFMRGQPKQAFPAAIQKGIALHHAIDAFTDAHPASLHAKEYLRPACGRYCGVFLDVVYDHFLATDPHYFSLAGLAAFSHDVYQTLDTYDTLLPSRFKRVFPIMKEHDWLFGYHSKEGIRNSFRGIYHRARYLAESAAAYQAFIAHYDELQKDYFDFMPEIIAFSKNYIASYR